MSAIISTDVIALISQKTGLSFDSVFDHVQAQVMGFIQKRDIFRLAAKSDVFIFSKLFNNDQRFVPKLQASLMRVDVCLQFSGTAPTMTIRTTDSNATQDELVLNGAAFVTNVSKSFDKQLVFGKKYNISFSQDCTIKYMNISEIPING